MSDELRDTTVVPEAKAKHPLLEFVPKFCQSFEEWLERWKATDYQDEKLGLLHGLAGKDNYFLNKPQAVFFLLEIADGYDGHEFSDGNRNHYGYEERAKNRKAIAQKAFAVLCLKFFKGGEQREPTPLWWWMLEDEALFNKVLWFLDPKRENYWRWKDDELNHARETLRKFLHEFTSLGWEFDTLCRRYGYRRAMETEEQRMVATRPQFIGILDRMRMLNELNDKELDEASIKKLTELALGEKLFLPPKALGSSGDNYRKAETLEEAVLGKSMAAQLVLMHRVKQKEQKRINALLEKDRRRCQEERRQHELDRIEEEKKALEERAKQLQG